MELTQLQYFRTVAKTQNITAAAELLHISQPTLSKVIKRLETDLGVQLFDRKASKLTLNPLGETYLVYVESALDALTRGRQCLESMRSGAGSGIRLASTFTGVPNMLVEQFVLEHPEISVAEVSAEPEEMNSLLMNDHVDFALTLSPLENFELEEVACVVEPMLLLLPDEAPFPSAPIRLSEFQQSRFAVFEGGNDSYATVLRCCNLAGFVPVIVYRSTRTQRVHELVNALGVCTLIPAHMALRAWERLPEKTRRHILLVDEPHCNRILRLYRKRKEDHQPEIEEFMDSSKKYFAQMNREISRLLLTIFPEKKELFRTGPTIELPEE